MTVSRDATSGWYVPASALEWGELLTGSGIGNPSALWQLQEASGAHADSVGAAPLTNSGLNYQQPIPGWSRYGVGTSVDGGGAGLSTTAIGNPGSGSVLLLALVYTTRIPAATRTIMGVGSGASHRYAQLLTSRIVQENANDGSASAAGTATIPGSVFPLIIQVDRTSGVYRVVTDQETITQSPYTAPANVGNLVSLGPAVGSGIAGYYLYSTLWTGSAAELSTSQLTDLIARIKHGYPGTTTLSAMQAGNTRLGFVMAIDGYPYLISNEDQSAVQAAWYATDWANQAVIGGLTFDLDNHQELNPWNPFGSGGMFKGKVQPDATDRLGIDMARTDAGEETLLSETATRTSEISVAFADRFLTTGEAHCGTECFAYGFVSGGSFWQQYGDPPGSHRGKYVAHGVKDSTTTYGAVRFAEHHRVSVQDDGVRHKPVVSEQPRTWKGRRVSLWAHTQDPATGALNTKDKALCLFLGELTEAQDESDTGHTSLLVENILDRIPKTTLLRDQWTASVDYGIQLKAGQKFSFKDSNDFSNATAMKTANDLVVVASGASGTNQANAGTYGVEEMASILNQWLGGESGAGRINGSYSFTSPEDVSGTPRTVLHMFIAGATNKTVSFSLKWPSPGWAVAMGYPGQAELFHTDTAGAGHAWPSPGPVQPFDFVGTDQDGTLKIPLEAQKGIFWDQADTLPAAAKSQLTAHDTTVGLFLLECETPMTLLATVDGNMLRRIRVLTSSFTNALGGYGQLLTAKVPVGSGPPKVRQIFVHEGPFKTVMKWLFYSTGSEGYNHADFDLLPHGQGLGLPYDALGPEFEASCDALPGADDTSTIIIDKPRTVEDIFKADLIVRNAHITWREGGIRFASWSSPSDATVAYVLDEDTKAEPIDNKISHRSASVLDSSWVRNFCKLNYNRDISQSISGGEDSFRATPLVLEDATSIDDAGGVPSPITLDLRNVYNDTDQIGQGVRGLAAGLLAWMTYWSRPLWKIRRSIALPYFEGRGVGDVVAVTDPFVRDPSTGTRGITTRPGLVVGHHYKIQTGGAGTKIKFSGEVDIVFLHNDRTFAYAPAAEVDETANTGGFTAGYDGVRTLKFKAHEHSLTTDTVDIGNMAIGDAVKIIQIDPDDPASALSWNRTLTSVTAASNQAVVDSALASPAFDNTKRYRMVYAGYGAVQGSQTIKSFQADQTHMLNHASPPDVYGEGPPATASVLAPTYFDHTQLPELLANDAYGPNVSASRDCAYDQEIALLLENMMDHQTRRSSPSYDPTASTNTGNDGWQLLRIEELFIGDLIYGKVNRYLYVAPHWCSTGTSATQLRVWLSGYPPSGTGTTNLDNQTPTYSIKAPASGNSWSLTALDTNWQTGPAQAYPLNDFAGHQYVYLIVEGTKSASFRGFERVSEGERFDTSEGTWTDYTVTKLSL